MTLGVDLMRGKVDMRKVERLEWEGGREVRKLGKMSRITIWRSFMGFVDTEYTWRGRVMYMQTVIIQVGQR